MSYQIAQEPLLTAPQIAEMLNVQIFIVLEVAK